MKPFKADETRKVFDLLGTSLDYRQFLESGGTTVNDARGLQGQLLLWACKRTHSCSCWPRTRFLNYKPVE